MIIAKSYAEVEMAEYFEKTHVWQSYEIKNPRDATGPWRRKGYNYILVAAYRRNGEVIFDQRTKLWKCRLPYSKRFNL